MKPAENLLAALRRKVTLYIAYEEDKEAQQYSDLNHVVKEKHDASDQTGRRVKPQRGKAAFDKPMQPFHAEDLILEKVPNRF